jgi:hypothetical protein
MPGRSFWNWLASFTGNSIVIASIHTFPLVFRMVSC